MVTLNKANYNLLVAHAKECLPEEACGLIAGKRSGEDAEIEYVYLLENCDHSSEHFSLDPAAQFAALKDMRARGLAPLGNWHSHPETPSRPSEEDKRLAFDSTAHYLILSLMEPDAPVLNAFRIRGTDAQNEGLIIKEDESWQI